jgi:hypothetical protein
MLQVHTYTHTYPLHQPPTNQPPHTHTTTPYSVRSVGQPSGPNFRHLRRGLHRPRPDLHQHLPEVSRLRRPPIALPHLPPHIHRHAHHVCLLRRSTRLCAFHLPARLRRPHSPILFLRTGCERLQLPSAGQNLPTHLPGTYIHIFTYYTYTHILIYSYTHMTHTTYHPYLYVICHITPPLFLP